jgi:hypothetical protein
MFSEVLQLQNQDNQDYESDVVIIMLPEAKLKSLCTERNMATVKELRTEMADPSIYS